MKGVEEALDFVIREIQAVSRHPKMYADDASGIEVALWCYHHVWANVIGRAADFLSALTQVRDEEKCRPYSFSFHFKIRLASQDDPSEDAAVAYVIRQYQRVDEKLGIVFPEGRDGHT